MSEAIYDIGIPAGDMGDPAEAKGLGARDKFAHI
jgi:hypothetical protein